MALPERPRPRPRPRMATTSSESAKGITAGSSKTPIDILDEEDAMFMRNRNTNLLSRKKIEEVVAKREALAPKSPSISDESEEDDGGSAPHRKHRKHHKSKSRPLPSWVHNIGQRKKRRQSELSDDEKSADGLYLSDDSTRETTVEKTPQAKRRREQSRSPSLTPPPPVPFEKMEQTRNILREAFGNPHPRPRSPPITMIEDDSDNEPLNLAPELAKLTAEFKSKRPLAAQRNANTDSIPDPSFVSEVTLHIKWIPHPEDETGKEERYEYKQRRNESFRTLLNEIADDAGILSSELTLTYNGVHVYSVSTPESLGIWSEAHLEACTSHTREYLDNERKARALSPSKPDPQVSEINTFLNGSAHESGAESDASQSKEGVDTFKLHLRNGDTTIVVTVRPTTKCSAIVATFLRKTGQPAKLEKKARVEVDGEKMNPSSAIGDAELEDGDLLDIVGI